MEQFLVYIVLLVYAALFLRLEFKVKGLSQSISQLADAIKSQRDSLERIEDGINDLRASHKRQLEKASSKGE